MNRRDAAGLLRNFLDDERLPARTRLPPERDLIVRLGMSRRALRQGLEVLEAEGRLPRHVGKGTFVGARPPGSEPGLSFVTARTSPAELMDILGAARRGSLRITAMSEHISLRAPRASRRSPSRVSPH